MEPYAAPVPPTLLLMVKVVGVEQVPCTQLLPPGQPQTSPELQPSGCPQVWLSQFGVQQVAFKAHLAGLAQPQLAPQPSGCPGPQLWPSQLGVHTQLPLTQTALAAQPQATPVLQSGCPQL